MPLAFSGQRLPSGNPKKKTRGRKVAKKTKKTGSKAKRLEEDPASFKAGESDEDDD
jgi:hypothetical protein